MHDMDHFSVLRHEMLAGLFSCREDFERRFVELEQARWPDRTRLTRGRLVKFMEHCFEYARSPYHCRYGTGMRVLGMLFQWAPGLVDLMRATGAHAIANMLLGEGRTKFSVPDRFSLEVFLEDWRRTGLGDMTAESVYGALVSKSRIQRRIADGEPDTLSLLRALFPERAEAEWCAARVQLADASDTSSAFAESVINDDAAEGEALIRQIAECDGLSVEYKHVAGQTAVRYGRNQKLAALLKRLHARRCQWCGIALETAKGGAYCEVHHVVALSDGGTDTSQNMLVLCPNHHVIMHHCLLEPPRAANGTWHVTSTLGSTVLRLNSPEQGAEPPFVAASGPESQGARPSEVTPDN